MTGRRLRSRARQSRNDDPADGGTESAQSPTSDSQGDASSSPPSSSRIRVVRRYPSRRTRSNVEPPWAVRAGTGQRRGKMASESEMDGSREKEDHDDDGMGSVRESYGQNSKQTRTRHSRRSRVPLSERNTSMQRLKHAAEDDVVAVEDDGSGPNAESDGTIDVSVECVDDDYDKDDGVQSVGSQSGSDNDDDATSDDGGRRRMTRGVRSALADIANKRRAQEERTAAPRKDSLGRRSKRRRSQSAADDRVNKSRRRSTRACPREQQHSVDGSESSTSLPFQGDKGMDYNEAEDSPATRPRRSRRFTVQRDASVSQQSQGQPRRLRVGKNCYASLTDDEETDGSQAGNDSDESEAPPTVRVRVTRSTKRKTSGSSRVRGSRSRRTRSARRDEVASENDGSGMEDSDFVVVTESDDDIRETRSRRRSKGKSGRGVARKRRAARTKTRVERAEVEEGPPQVLSPEERQARLDELVRQSEQINAQLQAAINRGRAERNAAAKQSRVKKDEASICPAASGSLSGHSHPQLSSPPNLSSTAPQSAVEASSCMQGSVADPPLQSQCEPPLSNADKKLNDSVNNSHGTVPGEVDANSTVSSTPDDPDDEDLKLPMAKGRTLQPHQVAGVRWLLQLDAGGYNGILADEMGLGKTIQALSLLASVISVGKRGPHLIIAPLAVASHWVEEAENWFPGVVKPYLHCGSAPDRLYRLHDALNDDDFDIFVTSYDLALRDIFGPMPNAISAAGGFRSTLRRLRNTEFEYLVVDEAHRLKNTSSKLTVALRKYKGAGRRILLTGTPLSNKLEELWALLNVLNPTIFDNSATFQSWFSSPFEDGIGLSNAEKAIVVARMHTVLRPFFRRRVRSDICQGFTHADEVIVQCPPSPLQVALQRYYQKVRRGFTKGTAKGVMIQLRKCASHPWIVSDAFHEDSDQLKDVPLTSSSGKFLFLHYAMPRLMAAGHRVLIFGQLKMTLDLVGDLLDVLDIPFFRLDGDTPGEDRGPMLSAFNKDDADTNVFLLSTRAGGVGINLQTADTVILVESDWNPSCDLQAVSRIQRIGQKKTVHIMRLVTHKQIDEIIVKRAQKKLRTQAVAVGAGKFSSGREDDVSLRQRDIEALLGALDAEAPLYAGREEIDGSEGVVVLSGPTPDALPFPTAAVPGQQPHELHTATKPVIPGSCGRDATASPALIASHPLQNSQRAVQFPHILQPGPHPETAGRNEVGHAPLLPSPSPHSNAQQVFTQGVSICGQTVVQLPYGKGATPGPSAMQSSAQPVLQQSSIQVAPILQQQLLSSGGVPQSNALLLQSTQSCRQPPSIPQLPPPGVQPASIPQPPPPGVQPASFPQPPPPGVQPASIPQPPPPGVQPASIPQPPPSGVQPASIPQPSPPGVQPASISQPPPPGAQPASIPQPPPPGAQPASIPQPPPPGAQPASIPQPLPPAVQQPPPMQPPEQIIKLSNANPLQFLPRPPQSAQSDGGMPVHLRPSPSPVLQSASTHQSAETNPYFPPAHSVMRAPVYQGPRHPGDHNATYQSHKVHTGPLGLNTPESSLTIPGMQAFSSSVAHGPGNASSGYSQGIPDPLAATRAITRMYLQFDGGQPSPLDKSSLVPVIPGEDGASLMKRYAKAWDPLLLRRGESSLPDIEHPVLSLASPDTVPAWLKDNKSLNYVHAALLADGPDAALEVVKDAVEDATALEGEARERRSRRRTTIRQSLRDLPSESDFIDSMSESSEDDSYASGMSREQRTFRSHRRQRRKLVASSEDDEYEPSLYLPSDEDGTPRANGSASAAPSTLVDVVTPNETGSAETGKPSPARNRLADNGSTKRRPGSANATPACASSVEAKTFPVREVRHEQKSDLRSDLVASGLVEASGSAKHIDLSSRRGKSRARMLRSLWYKPGPPVDTGPRSPLLSSGKDHDYLCAVSHKPLFRSPIRRRRSGSGGGSGSPASQSPLKEEVSRSSLLPPAQPREGTPPHLNTSLDVGREQVELSEAKPIVDAKVVTEVIDDGTEVIVLD